MSGYASRDMPPHNVVAVAANRGYAGVGEASAGLNNLGASPHCNCAKEHQQHGLFVSESCQNWHARSYW